MVAAVPLITAGIGAASSIYSSRQQANQASKQRRMQQEAMAKQEGIQRKQQQAAEAEQQKLQMEESDELRSRRVRGRKSLLAGSEQGVDLLGQRMGGL